MSDTDDPLLGYIVGGIFGAILIILIVGYFYNKKKQNNSSIRMRPHNNDSGRGTSTKVMPTPTTAAAAQIPHKIRMRRRATHDENDDQPRRVIERTRAGIELIFSEFDQSDDQMIDLREVRFCCSFFYLKPKRPDIFFRIHTVYPFSLSLSSLVSLFFHHTLHTLNTHTNTVQSTCCHTCSKTTNFTKSLTKQR
jgi:hypothetical protein